MKLKHRMRLCFRCQEATKLEDLKFYALKMFCQDCIDKIEENANKP